MNQNTKFIKDLTKKEMISGDESLLIQDDTGTKQAPLDAIVNKVVEQSTIGVDEAIATFKEAAEQHFGNNQQQIDTFIEETQARADEALTDVDQINQKIAETNAQLSTKTNQLNDRIDLIISNNNDTDGNSELVDIRSGNDGTIYKSAGECVRTIDAKVSTFVELKSSTTSTNIYNQKTSKKGTLNMGGIFTPDDSSSYICSDFLKLSLGKKYAFSYSHPTLGRYHLTFSRFVAYDLDKTFLSQTTSNTSITDVVDITVNADSEKYTLVVPKRDIYIRMQVGASLNEIMVKNGTDNIYEPYGDTIYNFGIKDNIVGEINLSQSVREKLNKTVEIPQIENKDKFYYTIHRNGICIGDSLTEGYHTSDDIDKSRSYPAYLSRLTNWNITNAGQSGITVSGWYDAHISKYNYADYDFAIIYLGTNGGLTDTLIQDTTISDDQTYTDYANTHTGSYCKIVETILEQNPKCKIYLIRWNGTTTSNVTVQIAEKYGLDTINLLDHTYFNLQDSKYHTDATHYNSLGYMCFAKNLLNFLEKIIEDKQLNYIEI